MLDRPAVTIDSDHFEDNWKSLREELEKIWLSSECYNCPKKKVCQTCAASMVTETGSFDKKPEYQCRLTDASLAAYEKILMESEDD